MIPAPHSAPIPPHDNRFRGILITNIRRFAATRARLGLLALSLGLMTGCGYTFGNVPREDVRRVCIPVFANRTLRRGFERDLTRAVHDRVKDTLPYNLSARDDADIVLLGEIVAINESILVEGPDDEVLEGLIQVSVAVRLEDSIGRPVPIYRQTLGGKSSDGATVFTDQAEYLPGRGESRDTATREALTEMAERIIQVLAGPPL